MEPNKQTRQTPDFFSKVLFVCTLITFSGQELIAQNSGSGPGKITVGEILMYVAIIIVVIAVAWVFASRQSDKMKKEHQNHVNVPRKHYEHPNDPHFKKLKKKTS